MSRDRRIVLALRSWMALSHLAILLMPVLVVLGTGALAVELQAQTRHELEVQGALVSILARAELRHARHDHPGATLGDLTEVLSPELARARGRTLAGMRITDDRGVVVATSGEGLDEDLSDQPEMIEALDGGTGYAIRPRPPQSERQPLNSPSRRARVRVFVAQPIHDETGHLEGVVLLSRTPREVVQAIYTMAPLRLLLGASAALLLTFAMALWVGYMFTRSLKAVAASARRFAAEPSSGLPDLAKPRRSHVREVRDMARAVDTMAIRLRERLGYISEFASHVSHEFKTPLASLRGSVELLRDDPDMPPTQRQRFLSNAMADVDRLERLLTGLLALARAEESSQRDPVDLAVLMADLGERYPDLSLDGRPGVLEGNPAQMEQVMVNLVENAWQHGGEGVSVTLRGWVEGASTGFEVIDDGPGISEANMSKVFERFFTTGREGGRTGLGLALVKAVVQTHGGEVSVQSEPGRTVFRVVLPRRNP